MKAFKKLIAVATAVAMLGLSGQDLEAQDYFASSSNVYGYEDSRDAPSLAPAIALGTVALVAIIAVALQDGHGGHGHAHE